MHPHVPRDADRHLEHAPAPMEHEALLYHDADALLAGVRAYVEPALARDEPVAMSIPRRSAEVLRPAFEGHDVHFLDMEEVGRNPNRIIPVLRGWTERHPGRRLTFIGEPIWVGRTAPEITEAHRHEALLDVAFADTPIRILCPYDAAGLDPEVLEGAEHTHGTIRCDGRSRPGRHHAAPLEALRRVADPLPPPPGPVPELPITDDLALVRSFVRAHGSAASLDATRVEQLALAANEAAANTLRHGPGDGVVRVWHDDGTLVCEVADGGRISDPLAGRRQPGSTREHGRGLWMVNQLCDLVELRSEPAGTTVRLHMRLS